MQVKVTGFNPYLKNGNASGRGKNGCPHKVQTDRLLQMMQFGSSQAAVLAHLPCVFREKPAVQFVQAEALSVQLLQNWSAQ